MSNIDLGFVQQIESKWKLKNKFFPSKIGGKPVFLDIENMLSYKDLKCSKCQQMMRFLLQIYAPIETNVNAFHRTLFVFCCYNNDCNELKTFRSQLPRINSCYSSEPPDYDFDDLSYDPKPQQFGHQLCNICGFEAKNKCSKCLSVSYCSRDHQIIDWRKGSHKLMCGKSDTSCEAFINNSLVFPEYQLIIGDNDSDESDCIDGNEGNDDSDLESNELKKYKEFINKSCPKYQTQNLDQFAEEDDSEENKVFEKFKRLTSGEQVIRYCSYDDVSEEQEPLWISTKNKPNFPIPNCQYCGSKRRFEFQIMPQLLNKILKSDETLDWGLLIVYTCSRSCSDTEVSYKEEYIWKQTIE